MTDDQAIPGNRLPNLRRRVERARNFPVNTCPSSRHVHMIAECLAKGGVYHQLTEEPEHCAASMLSVLESLWKARTRLQKMDPVGEARKLKASEKAVAAFTASYRAKQSA